jgi:hypothetical protein
MTDGVTAVATEKVLKGISDIEIGLSYGENET